MVKAKNGDEVDFYIYEAEDIDLRITINDVNTCLPDSIDEDVSLVWVATGSVGGVPFITKGTVDGSITIEDATNYIIRVHLDEVNTRNKIGIFYYETQITVSGYRRVLRLPLFKKGNFEIRQSDTDEVAVT